VLSITIAVPAFAFFSAGVTIGGLAGLRDSLTDTIAVGIFTGLVVGKMLGIVGTTFLMTRLRGYTLDRTIGWLDLLGMSFLGGIGFTVALLVGELSYGDGTSTDDKVKMAVLLGSCTAAVIGAAILAARNRRYRHAVSKPALRE
jgi:NhaA family Na+:H+ antiporter